MTCDAHALHQAARHDVRGVPEAARRISEADVPPYAGASLLDAFPSGKRDDWPSFLLQDHGTKLRPAAIAKSEISIAELTSVSYEKRSTSS